MYTLRCVTRIFKTINLINCIYCTFVQIKEEGDSELRYRYHRKGRNQKKAGYPRAISDGLTVVINAVLTINNKTIANIWSAVL